ncbi:hypothetical protein OCU04_001215 [Sclerotinia nivalis]|uniref:Uncharacterized protein n=1 Tax=Sclerotinia nivalis TaxID=352851 RepID=A0A9X0AXQ4_9HELO|nr:hypothetical protein OCU04_001215 [Sclerotinia nivalis]
MVLSWLYGFMVLWFMDGLQIAFLFLSPFSTASSSIIVSDGSSNLAGSFFLISYLFIVFSPGIRRRQLAAGQQREYIFCKFGWGWRMDCYWGWILSFGLGTEHGKGKGMAKIRTHRTRNITSYY